MEFEKLRSIIADTLGADEKRITMDTDFVSDLGADSLSLFQLTIAIEEEFDIEISPEAMEDIHSVKDAVEYIRNAVR